jgi:hypothetical protein
MTHSRTKRAAEVQDSIRRILFRFWDPIGVNDNPKLRNEYDSYIAPVYRILTGSRSEQELIEFLSRAGLDTGGLSSASQEQLRPIARQLLELDVRL